MVKLEPKINSIEKTLKDDMEKIQKAKEWLIGHDNELKTIKETLKKVDALDDLKIKVDRMVKLEPKINDLAFEKDTKHGVSGAYKFSVNSPSTFQEKQTLYFVPGLILPYKTLIYSLFITTNIKSSSKHNFNFKLCLIKNGSFQPIHSFEVISIINDCIMEHFDPPIQISSKSKIIITCDKKLNSMAVLTLSY